MSEPTITVRFYRIVMGVRTPYVMLLDARRNVLTEQVDHDALNRTLARGPLLPPALPNSITPTAPTPVSEWFAQSAPNPFPGTEALRSQYFNEVTAVEEEHRQRGVNCPDCVLGGILRQYKVTLQERGHLA